jgi:hypothetical protein
VRSEERQRRYGGFWTSHDPAYPGQVERAIVFTVEAWDINCPQHIHRRFSQRQVQPVIDQLRGRIAELEGALANLRSGHV